MGQVAALVVATEVVVVLWDGTVVCDDAAWVVAVVLLLELLDPQLARTQARPNTPTAATMRAFISCRLLRRAFECLLFPAGWSMPPGFGWAARSEGTGSVKLVPSRPSESGMRRAQRPMSAARSRHGTLQAHAWRSHGNLDVTSGDLAYSWLSPPLIQPVLMSQRAAGQPTGWSRVRRGWMYVQTLGGSCILGRGDQQRRRARTAIAYRCALAMSAFTLGTALTLSTIVSTLQPPAAGAASPGWSVTAQDSSLAGISCASPSDCMAVANSTEGGVALTTTDGGSTWTSHTLPAESGLLTAVSCASPSDCTAVANSSEGGVALMTTDGGTSWSSQTLPTASVTGQTVPYGSGSLTAVSCASPSDCVTVGYYVYNGTFTGIALTTTDGGATWTRQSVPYGSGLVTAVSCAAPSDCVAVGFDSVDTIEGPASVGVALTSRDGGTTWTSQRLPAGVADLSDVSCASSSDCMAAGYGSSGGVVVSTTDGGATWTSSTLPAESGLLTAISCSSPSACTAVGDGNPGAVALATSDGGTTWTSTSVPNQVSYISGISCPSISLCGATGSGAGSGGFLLTYGGDALTESPPANGYWLVGADGGVFAFDVPFYGSAGGLHLNQKVVGMSAAPGAIGYWLVAKDGGVFSYGVPFHGSMGGAPLNEPVVGIAATADGGGYYLVAADGGVFTFGDAKFAGSLGEVHLNEPIVGIAVTADNNGYYLVAADGGVFAFGDAVFRGSSFGAPLNSPAVGIALDSSGYGLVHSNGWVSSFAAADVSFDPVPLLNAPVVGIASTPGGEGFRLVAADGEVFCSQAAFLGSMGRQPLNAPVVGIASSG